MIIVYQTYIIYKKKYSEKLVTNNTIPSTGLIMPGDYT